MANQAAANALTRLAEAIKAAQTAIGADSESARASPTVAELRDLYLAWLAKNRSPALLREAKRHLARFCEVSGGRPALSVDGSMLEIFQDSLLADGHAPLYVKKHAISVRALFRAGVLRGWLPEGFRPFARVEAMRLAPRPLLESDLPTDEEVRGLMDLAKPFFKGMLRVYHATGARTHELIDADCGDFQPAGRSIVLGSHKRALTLREYRPRTILLNDEAFGVIATRCEGRPADAPIFPTRTGARFTSALLGDMFARLRKRVGVRGHITIYSLRHLWISEMLMAGHDSLLVARMAGTSVKMIETTYGHFKTSSFREAQATLDAIRKGRM